MAEYELIETSRKSKKRLIFNLGDKFKEFTVISEQQYKVKSSNHIYLKCQCSCGTICYERCDLLKKGNTFSCPRCSKVIRNLKYIDIGEMTGIMFRNIKQRANERNLEFNLTIDYLNNLYNLQKGKCALSNLDINIRQTKSNKTTASLDRIDNNIGYIEGNVQWVHVRVNIMKGNLDQNLFIHICSLINKNNNLQDNFDPSLLNESCFNESKVSRKEQRLAVEDIQTNNTATNARQPEEILVEDIV